MRGAPCISMDFDMPINASDKEPTIIPNNDSMKERYQAHLKSLKRPYAMVKLTIVSDR